MSTQQRSISCEGEEIAYQEKVSARAKRVCLKISPAGEVVASRPWWVSSRQLKNFVRAKSGWLRSRLNMIKQAANNPLLRIDRKSYLQYKEESRQFIKSRVDHFNRRYGFKYNRVAIRNQRSLWGSCSQKRNLNFNYKLLFLPARIADYIVVHELCHLQELNHSPQFWQLVARTIPDYKEQRKTLQELIKN